MNVTSDERANFVQNYVKYLRWNRIPDVEMPRSKADLDALLSRLDAHANENPYEEDIWGLFDAIHRDPEFAWQLLLEILDATDIADVGLLGAGDLETFVHVHAVPFADRIEKEIRDNWKFRKAFESVYIGTQTPESVGRRFNAAMRENGVAEDTLIDWWK